MSDVADWWQTSIIDMEPGRISIRGEQIQDLIGNLSFAEMVWLMICGTKPEPGRPDCWKPRSSPPWIMARKPLRLLPPAWLLRAG